MIGGTVGEQNMTENEIPLEKAFLAFGGSFFSSRLKQTETSVIYNDCEVITRKNLCLISAIKAKLMNAKRWGKLFSTRNQKRR